MIDTLEAKKVFVIDDQSAYSKGIADVVVPQLEDDGVDVSTDSVSQTNTDYSALVSKIADDTDVVFLPWMLAANAQLFGDQMSEQAKTATIFGTDGVFSPQDFKVEGLLPLHVLARHPERPGLRRPRAGVRGPVRAVRRVRAHDLSGDTGRARRGQEGLRRRRRTPDIATVAENVKNTDISGLCPRPADRVRVERRDEGREVLRVHDQGRQVRDRALVGARAYFSRTASRGTSPGRLSFSCSPAWTSSSSNSSTA